MSDGVLHKIVTPRIAFPFLAVLVLIVVAILVSIFYIRNPTATDGVFGHSGEESSSLSPYEAADLQNPPSSQTEHHQSEAVTGVPSSLTSTRESEVHDFGSTTTKLHLASEGSSSDPVSSTTTTIASVTEQSQTEAPTDGTTVYVAARAIEPVEHV
ncbi:hypothetical protein WR25_23252 isoform B [Diploscapter pachys]|uniref:Uncharacterized protein n=1 Tax=Diploscapter pachys TaxID=2018661 RepID=A0A2A2JHJ8_9BILA|nr:hypothetical protein WR25_23252 isoform A [Diploscapter pachys]PAV61238.1 hypothetical protein WR25_23252 isoform B [Diploscapter pachys]